MNSHRRRARRIFAGGTALIVAAGLFTFFVADQKLPAIFFLMGYAAGLCCLGLAVLTDREGT